MTTSTTQLKKWPFWLLLVSVAAVTAWWLCRPPQSRPTSEATRKELVLRDGKLYRNNESAPFQGFLIERYSGGKSNLKSRSQVRKGRLNGFSEGWHTNGQMEVKEFFTNGYSHGLRTRWHANGAKMSETMIVSGIVSGISRRWYSNGVLEAMLTLKNGQPDGTCKSYYESGFLKAAATMKDGKAVETKTWKDGELKETELSKMDMK